MVAALVVGVAGVAVLTFRDAPRTRTSAPAPSLAAGVPADDPLAPAPALGLDIPAPKLLASDQAQTLWAPVARATPVRERPSASARVVGRLAARTPEGTTNIAIVGGRGHARGALWVPVRAAEVRGWVPRSALGGYEIVDEQLLVDTRALTATLVRAGETIFRAPIGVGTVAAPTPTGSFHVRNKLTRYRSPTYGPVAFGTTAQSETLTDWPAGGFVGNPRHRSTRAPSGSRLPRLHPAAQRGHPGPREADADRHAGEDHVITARLVLVVAVVALVTAVPLASAQDAPPRDLWSEFPLEPTQTTEAPPATVPLPRRLRASRPRWRSRVLAASRPPTRRRPAGSGRR